MGHYHDTTAQAATHSRNPWKWIPTLYFAEALPYVADHCGMQRVCWVIIDSSDVKKADIAAKYFNYDVAVYGEDFAKLGRRMGVPAEVFEKTMTEYNENAEDGDDPVFGKDEDYLRPRIEKALEGKLRKIVLDATRIEFAKLRNDAGMLGGFFHFKQRQGL